MLNLIKKDLILQKAFLPAYLLFLVAYLWAGMDVAYVLIICSAVFVINTHQSDAKDNANILVNSLPYTRKEIISSRYIGTLLFTIVTIPFCLVGKYFIVDGMKIQASLESFILGFLAVMLITAFYIPFFVAFKVQTLVPVFIFLSIGVIYLIRNTAYLLNKYANDVLNFFKEISDLKLFFVISVIAVGCYGVSWILSIRIYQNKAF
ncbi:MULTISPECIES: ABC-2 transporter permease [Bacillus cereus group]|jgi:ABC-2 type transport system permease protein|nr:MULTISPECIES: ABC-2 transporter permease [Bacillus cereus group]MCP1399071.1 ABC-2 type transport system permease protein [Bacillus cereus]MED2919882.1 ABC-2 transporter permease [Bacillus thuringiensis]MED2924653.1 ABC-2 transporter permease [Bacillus thuringiensis]MED3050502.1 ABC-2 transporter permease [Bacillus thuringiensis]MED3686510.1 ABC-2 transporter permease [Bacillus thuringiensis]